MSILGIILDPIKKKVTDDPGNLTPIVISSVAVGSIAGGNATITWTTSAASSSRVSYGVSPNRSQTTSETDTSPLVTNHSVTLNNLSAGKIYLFRVRSRYGGGTDGMGNSVMDGYQFTQDGSFVAA